MFSTGLEINGNIIFEINLRRQLIPFQNHLIQKTIVKSGINSMRFKIGIRIKRN